MLVMAREWTLGELSEMHSIELPMDSLQERNEVLKKTNVAVQETLL